MNCLDKTAGKAMAYNIYRTISTLHLLLIHYLQAPRGAILARDNVSAFVEKAYMSTIFRFSYTGMLSFRQSNVNENEHISSSSPLYIFFNN